MRINLLTIFMLVFLYGNNIWAQQINIKDIDESAFPFINITIEVPANKSINFSELKILENDEPVELKIDSSFFDGQKTMLCFLVDEALLTSSIGKKIISKTLSNAGERLEKNDLLNVFLTGNEEKETKCMLPLSFEFTSDFKGLINQFESSLLTGITDGKRKDLFCAINESLDFIHNKSTALSQKYLIVLKKRGSKVSEWPALRAKAGAQLIKLSSIELSDGLGEHNEQEVLSYTISQLDSLELVSVAGNPNLKSFLLSFYTKQTKDINTFKLTYNEFEQVGTFTRPTRESSSDQKIFIILTFFLFILSIALAVYIMRLKKKSPKVISSSSKNNTLLKKEQSKIVANISPKKTNYGSITPYITIELDGETERFDLKKLRTTIGRHSDNDILIANLTISNHHATVTNEGGVFYIQDNDSTNGTFVNDIKITKSAIKPEDSVRLGKAKLYLTY